LEALKNDTELTTFYKSVEATPDVKKVLQGGKVFVFAPNDASLKALNVTAIPEKVLQYHIAEATEELAEGLNIITSLDGDQVLKVTKTGNAVSVASGVPSVTATASPILDTNDQGIIFVLDSVLSAPEAVETTMEKLGLSTLLTLLNTTNLSTVVPGLAALTIFAPSNAAFEAYFKQQGVADAVSFNSTDAKKLLLEHVDTAKAIYSNELLKMKNLTMGGKTWDISGATIGGAGITDANVLVTNGAIHVIDRVLGGPAAAAASTSGLTGGEVVAIVIGVLAGVAIIGYCCFRSSKRDDDYQPI